MLAQPHAEPLRQARWVQRLGDTVTARARDDRGEAEDRGHGDAAASPAARTGRCRERGRSSVVKLSAADQAWRAPLDVACSACGREPSHPQVRHRFVYAAYHQPTVARERGPRQYVAALCAPCYEADRRAGTGAARNRFLRQIRHWSGQPANRAVVVYLLEHPEGVTGEEWRADHCFYGGVAIATGALPATADRD